MFKVGDEVVLPLKIEKICNEELVGAKSEEDVTYLFKIEEANRVLKPREAKTYTKGLADAWELAKKIYHAPCDGGYSANEIKNIFGCNVGIMSKFTAEEALAKISEYEKEKKIEVGDVVTRFEGDDAVVVNVQGNGINLLHRNGLVSVMVSAENCKKTGKHIDIESLLRQIGE